VFFLPPFALSHFFGTHEKLALEEGEGVGRCVATPFLWGVGGGVDRIDT
jgi:hypothetical protein